MKEKPYEASCLVPDLRILVERLVNERFLEFDFIDRNEFAIL